MEGDVPQSSTYSSIKASLDTHETDAELSTSENENENNYKINIFNASPGTAYTIFVSAKSGNSNSETKHYTFRARE